jgi:predicted acylesterase/phospholipase RssA
MSREHPPLITEQEAPPLTGKPSPLALIMKGGGVKGLALIGAIQELERFFTFDWYVGTSAGAIAASLLAAGYTARELEPILREKSFNDFISDPLPRRLWNLITARGLYSGLEFERWIDDLVVAKLGEMGREVPYDRRELQCLPKRVSLYATQLGYGTVEFDSQDARKRMTTLVQHAVRCSMSIPFFFTAQSIEGEPVVDGGVLHNFPAERWISQNRETPYLALYLGPKIYAPDRRRSFLADLFEVSINRDDAAFINKNRDRVIVIDPSPIQTTDFDLTADEKDLLVRAGRAAALEHLCTYAKSSGIASEQVTEANQGVEQLRQRVVTARRSRSHRRRRRVAGALVGALAVAIGTHQAWMHNKVKLTSPHAADNPSTPRGADAGAVRSGSDPKPGRARPPVFESIHDEITLTQALRLEKFAVANSDFQKLGTADLRFVQRGSGANLCMSVAVTNVSSDSVYIRGLRFRLESKSESEPIVDNDTKIARIAITFKAVPSDEALMQLKARYHLGASDCYEELCNVDVSGRFTGRDLTRLRMESVVDAANVEGLGTGMSDVSLSSTVSPRSPIDRRSRRIDIDVNKLVKREAAERFIIRLPFVQGGLYRAEGRIEYGDSELELPTLTVSVKK